MTVIRLPTRYQYEAIKRSTAKDPRLARRLGLPVEVVECVRRAGSLRAAIEDYVPTGTRVRLDAPMELGFVGEPITGELGTANGSDDGDGKLFVVWDGGASFAVLPCDRISLACE